MTEIFEDNVDVTCIIGDGSTNEGEFSNRQRLVEDEDENVWEWDILDAEVVLTRNSTPNYVDMRITPADGTPFPTSPQDRSSDGGLLGLEFTLDVDTQLRADTPGEEVTRLFTGNVANMTPTGDYTFEAIANDATQEPFVSEDSSGGRDIQNDYITIGQPAFNTRHIPGGFPIPDDLFDRSILVSEVIDKVCDRMDIPEERRNINLDEDGIEIGETPRGLPIIQGYDELIEFESWSVNIDEALTTAEEASNSHWWFDRYGNFNFGALRPNEDIYAYEIQFIKDSSAGMTTPPYRSVQVIGDGVASEGGWSSSSLVSETNYTTSGNVYIDDDDADLAEPTFTYRNMEIATASEADNVRERILDKLRDQRAEGEVDVVGFPELYPNDSIVMPSTESQPMGGQRYGVNTVKHRLNTSDGFITKVQVDGLDSGQETLYDTDQDVDALQEDLERSRQRGISGHSSGSGGMYLS